MHAFSNVQVRENGPIQALLADMLANLVIRADVLKLKKALDITQANTSVWDCIRSCHWGGANDEGIKVQDCL